MQRMGMVPPPKKIICPTCGKPIEPEKRRGRPRRFHPGCSPFEPRKPAQWPLPPAAKPTTNLILDCHWVFWNRYPV